MTGGSNQLKKSIPNQLPDTITIQKTELSLFSDCCLIDYMTTTL